MATRMFSVMKLLLKCCVCWGTVRRTDWQTFGTSRVRVENGRGDGRRRARVARGEVAARVVHWSQTGERWQAAGQCERVGREAERAPSTSSQKPGMRWVLFLCDTFSRLTRARLANNNLVRRVILLASNEWYEACLVYFVHNFMGGLERGAYWNNVRAILDDRNPARCTWTYSQPLRSVPTLISIDDNEYLWMLVTLLSIEL